MQVKYGGSTHHIMLMLKSAGNRPKTVANLKFISGKKLSAIERALEQLDKHRLITSSRNDQGASLYSLNPYGVEYLIQMAKHRPLVQDRC